jgi:competence protein ComEA
MKRFFKITIGLLIVYVIIRLLIEYLRPVRVRLDDHAGSPPRPEPSPPPPPLPREPACLDLNQADVAALTTLPGVGPALAERIVAHRQQVGRFASLDDLMRVRGIGPALVERLRPLVK